jgi:hypothetical protein
MKIIFTLASFFLALTLFVGGTHVRVAYAEPLAVSCNQEIDPATGHFSNPCDFADLMLQIQKVITFLLVDIAIPMAAIAFAYAGFLFMTSGGNSGQVERAKGIFKKVFIGSLIALAAWLIVKAVMMGLGFKDGEFKTFYTS